MEERMTIPMHEIGWIAGFLEGEGYFDIHGSRIEVEQVENDPITKLSNLFGGTRTKRKRENKRDINRWRLYPEISLQVMITIKPFMSVIRQNQINLCLENRRNLEPLKTVGRKWEVGWIAGFLEGEGAFRLYKYGGVEIKASQNNWEPIKRLMDICGGHLYEYKRKSNPINIWTIKGIMAVKVMEAIKGMMSEKRKAEIERCLKGWNGKRGDEKFGG